MAPLPGQSKAPTPSEVFRSDAANSYRPFVLAREGNSFRFLGPSRVSSFAPETFEGEIHATSISAFGACGDRPAVGGRRGQLAGCVADPYRVPDPDGQQHPSRHDVAAPRGGAVGVV